MGWSSTRSGGVVEKHAKIRSLPRNHGRTKPPVQILISRKLCKGSRMSQSLGARPPELLRRSSHQNRLRQGVPNVHLSNAHLPLDPCWLLVVAHAMQQNWHQSKTEGERRTERDAVVWQHHLAHRGHLVFGNKFAPKISGQVKFLMGVPGAVLSQNQVGPKITLVGSEFLTNYNAAKLPAKFLPAFPPSSARKNAETFHRQASAAWAGNRISHSENHSSNSESSATHTPKLLESSEHGPLTLRALERLF